MAEVIMDHFDFVQTGTDYKFMISIMVVLSSSSSIFYFLSSVLPPFFLSDDLNIPVPP